MKNANNKDALWDLVVKTGLPEAYCMYKAEERRIDGRDQDGRDLSESR